ncbi:phosphatase PAP2 family protein [bacterium]|nr:phosphatase PAP2 family protein [bacterium]|tara:strand:- start:45 stop:686 length:642 start_codon:yes stop_codon:yes gene_type:complete
MMIKLKTLLREGLKDMVFGKTIKPRHKKRMDQKVTLFNENPKLTITPPPANDSQKTKSEIHYLLAYNDGVIDRKVVKEYDDIIKPFMSAVEKNGVQVSSDELTQIFMESSKFIIQLKYKFNRPRPYQIAEHYEIEDFKRHKLDTANSPSYPSGHAVQGRVIALYLSDKDPDNRKEYMMIGHNISESRIMARAHFPSDRKYGDMLGDELYKEMK